MMDNTILFDDVMGMDDSWREASNDVLTDTDRDLMAHDAVMCNPKACSSVTIREV